MAVNYTVLEMIFSDVLSQTTPENLLLVTRSISTFRSLLAISDGPPYAKSFLMQLYFFSGFYALLGILSLIPLIIRWRDGASMAFYKIIPTSKGKLICPQTAVTFNAFSSLFAFLAQGYIWKIIYVNFQGKDQHNQILWRTLVWIPVWTIVIEAAWSMTVTRLKTAVISPSAVLINCFFLTALAIFISSILTFFILSNINFNEAIDLNPEAYQKVAALISNYTGQVTITDILPIAYLFNKEMDLISKVALYWQYGWASLATALGLAVIIYVIMFWSYINILKEQLYAIDINITLLGTFEKSAAKMCEQISQRAQKKQVYVGLIITCICTLISSFVLLGLTCWVAADLNIVTMSTYAQLAELISFWSYAILGSIASGLAIARALATRTKKDSPLSNERGDWTVATNAQLQLEEKNWWKRGFAAPSVKEPSFAAMPLPTNAIVEISEMMREDTIEGRGEIGLGLDESIFKKTNASTLAVDLNKSIDSDSKSKRDQQVSEHR